MPMPAISEHDALPAGTRLGEFEIECVLGVGGFGVVYRALDHALERRVAIKEYMPASLAGRGEGGRVVLRGAQHAETFELGLHSFINEARLLARFDHPALVKVYRFWEGNDTAYMVMPCYEGATLRDARRGMSQPPTQEWLRSLLDPLLGALDVLHRAQVYHRDIAPDNILLLGDASGEGGEGRHALPVLLDFGAARRVIGDHTQTLTAIVKPSFAPIEQYAEATTLRQGPWTDLYALAAVVHYCITGRPPLPATARAVADELPALVGMAPSLARDFGRHYEPGFLAAVDHALAVKPTDRPASALAWRLALDGVRPAVGQPGLAAGADGSIPRTVYVNPGPGVDAGGEQRDPTAYATTAPAAGPLRAAGGYPTTVPQPPAAATGAEEVRPETAPKEAAATMQGMGADLPAMALPPGGMPLPPERVRSGPSWRWGLALGLGLAAAGILAAWALRATLARDDGTLQGRAPQADQGAQVAQAATGSGSAKARGEREPAEARDRHEAQAGGAEKGAQKSSERAAPRPAQRPRREPAPEQATQAAQVARTLPSPREACGDRVFIALALCMKRQCNKPELAGHPQCVQMRQQEEANRQNLP